MLSLKKWRSFPHTEVGLQSVETLESFTHGAERSHEGCQEEQSSITVLLTSFSEKGSPLQHFAEDKMCLKNSSLREGPSPFGQKG